MRILFSAHDPGGCNLLLPLIDAFKNQDCVSVFLAMAGPAKAKVSGFTDRGAELIDLPSFSILDFPNEYDVREKDIIEVLDYIKPDILFTATSINSNIERFVIKYGKQAGIPTLSYIDSWLGEDIRFSSKLITVIPDYIFVCDPEMKDTYSKFEAENCKVVDVGNPYLEKLAVEFERKNSNDYVKDRILFFSENIRHYYPEERFNEIHIIQSIIASYNYPRRLDIVIRPHPLESKAHWRSFIEYSKYANEFIHLSLDEYDDFRESVQQSALTFGISSMALIEASIMGRYTFSFQVDILDKRKFLYIPFNTYNIICLKSIEDVCKELSIAGEKTSNFRRDQEERVVEKVIKLVTSL